MKTSVQAQPLIVVKDVIASTKWYCLLLEGFPTHGGTDYEQILVDYQMVLQIHSTEPDAHHGPLRQMGAAVGNGVLLWFEVDDFEAMLKRVEKLAPEVERGPLETPLAKQKELWLRDPDGYQVVVAGPSAYPRNPIQRRQREE